jgi:hypothetical protein
MALRLRAASTATTMRNRILRRGSEKPAAI